MRIHLRKASGAADASGPDPPDDDQVISLDEAQLEQLSGVFAAPRWLRDLGIASWLFAGAFIVLAGVIWLIGATAEITGPVVVAFLLACVTQPVVRWLGRHHIGRAGAAAIMVLSFFALGDHHQPHGDRRDQLRVVGHLVDHVLCRRHDLWLDAGRRDQLLELVEQHGHGTGKHDRRRQDADRRDRDGISGITSLILGLSFTMLSLFFLLKDGPSMRRWVDEHLGVPKPVGHTITGDVIVALQRYFAGVTIVAAFNAILVGLGGADPRCAPRRHDRRRDVRVRLHPLSRSVRRRRVRSPDDARVSGHDGRADHAASS